MYVLFYESRNLYILLFKLKFILILEIGIKDNVR